jgi:hypothetical protein
MDAVLQTGDAQQVILVGTRGHLHEMQELVRLLDVPTEKTAPDHERVVLTLRHADPRRVARSVLRLPNAGSATAAGRRLVLEGTPAWLHRAQRQVIRAELNEPETLGVPAR